MLAQTNSIRRYTTNKSITMKNEEIYVYDGINGQLLNFDTIEDAKKCIQEDFYEKDEGWHPDIESVFILTKTHEVNMKDLDNGFYQLEINDVIEARIKQAKIDLLEELQDTKGDEYYKVNQNIKAKLMELKP